MNNNITYLRNLLLITMFTMLTVPCVHAQEFVRCAGFDATIIGTNGNDVINVDTDDEVIHGLGGNDTIRARSPGGEGGGALVCGGNGNDRLFSGVISDTLNGNDGNDRLFGGDSSDTLNGNDGNDALDGGPDFDSCNGGPGTDTAVRCEDDSDVEGRVDRGLILGGADVDIPIDLQNELRRRGFASLSLINVNGAVQIVNFRGQNVTPCGIFRGTRTPRRCGLTGVRVLNRNRITIFVAQDRRAPTTAGLEALRSPRRRCIVIRVGRRLLALHSFRTRFPPGAFPCHLGRHRRR